MPIRSQHQWGWAFAAEQRGELAPGTAARWAHLSAPFARLPAHAGGGAVGFPTGLPSAWPPPATDATQEPSAPEPEPAPVAEAAPTKPRRRLGGLAAAGVAAVALVFGLGLAARWSK